MTKSMVGASPLRGRLMTDHFRKFSAEAGNRATPRVVAFSERMIAREHHDERLLCYQLVFKVGLLFPTEKGDIKSPTLEVVCKHCGMVARNSDFDIEQFVSKDGCGTRQPVDLLSVLEPHGESRLDRLRG